MKTSVVLNQENLSSVLSNVKVPNYNRDEIITSIVHIGVGNFHRSHQAYYTDMLMEQFGVTDCGICGIGLLDYDRKIYNILKDQDGLYTLMVKELDGTYSARVIGSIVEFIFAPENPLAVIEKIAHPDIKIVSLTITEGGYNLNEATGKFDFSNPVIIEDMKNPRSPKTVFGYLTQALKLRMERELGGITIQSCDNIQGNGDVAKKALTDYIKETEPDLLPWFEENVSFPNAMVDRITPVTVLEDKEILKEEFLIDDQWPVVSEPFIQWVIEDDFKAGRPVWEKVGAQFVENVIPFENMKLRLLNAGHTLLGMLGALYGYDTIDEAANDPDFEKFLVDFMDIEVTPTLGDLGEINLKDYKKSLVDRFQNIYIKDLISRICSESSAKVPIFLLPTIKDQITGKGNISRANFVVAAWCRYNDGVDENNKDYEIKDAMSDRLIRAAALSHKDPVEFLKIEPIFGDLIENKDFVESFTIALEKLREKGVKNCVQDINATETNLS
ncbi:mannitol 2-dehydrogenase [Salegentibacter echinorum]|uniref:Mannitol 2-dehydrogenase n=1 Tax=Salegentibacter echinorum TaxID=1073325 RepID=A0A1M5K0P6_SALEC|nr:mannitol dehydrogenase family protein [Salegentibacter echinorum]SHG46358.1 mannitol 2-dehydrogenase [Salegentibacter echinorum]